MLTACRPGEVRSARWREIDRKVALWAIPAERMKMREEHRRRELVFPSPYYPSKPLSENTFNSALARMGKSITTARGFRALF